MFKSKNLLNGDVIYAFFLLYIISKNQSNYVYNLEKYTTFFKKKNVSGLYKVQSWISSV